MEGVVQRPAWLLRNLGVATAYLVTALPAFQGADPCVPATAVFPPAGIALAAALAWGWRALAGVLLGAFLLNLVLLGSLALPLWGLLLAALGIAAGSTLQAWVGSRLCQRFARVQLADGSDGWNELQVVFLGGLLSCAIAAVTGSLIQLAAGRLPLNELSFNLLTWWVGDGLGVAIFTPLLLFAYRLYRRQPARWGRALAAPLAALFLVMLVFSLVNLRGEQALETGFREQARTLVEHINLRLTARAEALRSIRRFWQSSESVEQEEFHEFVGETLEAHPDIRLLAWAPLQAGQPQLRYVEPATQADLRGRVLEGAPLQQALVRARDSGDLSALPGRDLTLAPALQRSLFMLTPIYANGVPLGTVEQRRAAFQGVVLAAFELAPEAPAAGAGLLLRVEDDGQPRPTLLFASAGRPEGNPLVWSTRLAMGERQWLATVTTPQGYRASHLSVEALLVLMGGFFLASLALAQALALYRTQEWKEQSRRSEQAREMAEQEARVKGAFLATMSHEIRTPMNGVIGMTQLLADTSLNDEQQHYVSTIRRSCEALLHILNDILDYSKIEAGRLQIEQVSFNLHELVQECCQLFLPQSRQSGIPLLLELEHDLPEQVVGDPVRIRQVLINLLGNAFKFTRQGRVVLRVRPWRRGDGQVDVRFEVQDTGIGIADVQRARLFESFSQGDSSITRKYGGTGLGLSICRLLVDLMGGEIGVHTAYGKGSLFWFRLPLAVAAAEDALPAPETVVPAPAAESPLPGLRVLVAEDNPVNQQVLAGFLRRHGVTPRVAADGVEALHVLTTERQPFDAVFMDCEMPNMDGYTATERIRQWEAAEQRPAVFICGVSAHVIPEYRERALAAGMNDFIAKPLRREELERVLEKIKAQYPLPRAL